MHIKYIKMLNKQYSFGFKNFMTFLRHKHKNLFKITENQTLYLMTSLFTVIRVS
jgi:hypothetical protein